MNKPVEIQSTLEVQPRSNSALFWLGLVSAVYEVVLSTAITAGVAVPWYLGAIGAGLGAALIFISGNNPSLKNQY